MFTQNSKIYIAGHQGMVGSAIVRELKAKNYHSIVTRSKSEVDLTNQQDVKTFLESERPDYIVIAAAKVGGIHANNEYPADFIYSNLMIECNLIHQAFLAGVRNILFLGSSCIYPKFATQPMKEDALLTGLLEPTNEPYAIAKIAGIKLCESYNRQHGTNYRSAMPCNLYGPGDNFHLENSHVIPALIKKIHMAKESHSPSFNVWGSGNALREFLHVEDFARASIHIMLMGDSEFWTKVDARCSHINVGFGSDISIKELALTLKNVIEYNGELEFDISKPDGAPQKLMDSGLLSSLGWKPSLSLEEGLKKTYEWYLSNLNQLRQQ